MHNFNLSATTGIFHLLEAINKRKIFSLQVKHRFINIAKTKLGSCSEEEIAGAFVRLHYRLHELAKFNGQLYEVDTAIGYEDPEKVDAFVRSVKNSYIKFFNNYRFSESDSAESSVDSATAMTDSLFALASNS